MACSKKALVVFLAVPLLMMALLAATASADHLCGQVPHCERKPKPRIGILSGRGIKPNVAAEMSGPDFAPQLFLQEEGADVIFNVRGETLPAHKIMLTTRSPVFKAQLLYGQLNEAKVQCVTAEDMQPVVFKALLNFIYTDAVPDFGADLNDEGYSETIKHLLVAADKYSMDRLKLLCGSILAKDLCVETVASTLVLAYQHNCESLKDICIEFMASSDMVAVWQLKVMKMPKELALLS
ncbi:BTB/POZ and MATH domain-containing protein 1-like [Panicum miliaceum]|uniref:BTB/POZ and MATH domain-containing protein 1-like n=1 Tax=Panicum miliaceum TaxID=4540 RepID=A0A3L6RIB8_PANMI|nr:BTB/POZ and MATH domain-containing protein 1-like [Panicum miliaceum]